MENEEEIRREIICIWWEMFKLETFDCKSELSLSSRCSSETNDREIGEIFFSQTYPRRKRDVPFTLRDFFAVAVSWKIKSLSAFKNNSTSLFNKTRKWKIILWQNNLKATIMMFKLLKPSHTNTNKHCYYDKSVVSDVNFCQTLLRRMFFMILYDGGL